MNVGVIGCGHWGPNHLRIFASLPNSVVIAVADKDLSRLKKIKTLYPNVQIVKNYKELLDIHNLEAVIVASPTSTHYEIAKESLEAGKHVLCEKPLCKSVRQGEELVAIAKIKNLILMVGHVYMFNPGIVKLKQLVSTENIGRIYYFSATRTNMGPLRNDVNSVYDLASHDIAIFNFLLENRPLEVSAVGTSYLQKGLEDIAFISMKYPNDILANIRVSWLDAKKVRQITAVGEKKTVFWDELSSIGPLMVYEYRSPREPYYSDYGEYQLLAREGNVVIPKVEMEEPLRLQANYFLSCLDSGTNEFCNGSQGLDVVRVLIAATKSISKGGRPVKIDY